MQILYILWFKILKLGKSMKSKQKEKALRNKTIDFTLDSAEGQEYGGRSLKISLFFGWKRLNLFYVAKI